MIKDTWVRCDACGTEWPEELITVYGKDLLCPLCLMDLEQAMEEIDKQRTQERNNQE